VIVIAGWLSKGFPCWRRYLAVSPLVVVEESAIFDDALEIGSKPRVNSASRSLRRGGCVSIKTEIGRGQQPMFWSFVRKFFRIF